MFLMHATVTVNSNSYCTFSQVCLRQWTKAHEPVLVIFKWNRHQLKRQKLCSTKTLFNAWIITGKENFKSHIELLRNLFRSMEVNDRIVVGKFDWSPLPNLWRLWKDVSFLPSMDNCCSLQNAQPWCDVTRIFMVPLYHNSQPWMHKFLLKVYSTRNARKPHNLG